MSEIVPEAPVPAEQFTLRGAVGQYVGENTDDLADKTADVDQAFAAERHAQARVCRTPIAEVSDDEWPVDLVEALCRRVAVNLAVRGLPLGLATSVSELGATQARVGGMDREVRRLEAPFRKLPVG